MALHCRGCGKFVAENADACGRCSLETEFGRDLRMRRENALQAAEDRWWGAVVMCAMICVVGITIFAAIQKRAEELERHETPKKQVQILR